MAANQSPSSLKVEIFNNGDKIIIVALTIEHTVGDKK